MESVSYILWGIVVPFVLAFLGVKILKKWTWVIISIEVFIVLYLSFSGIIENNPMGTMQRQLSSYFGNITNDFYLKYVPLIIMTTMFMQLLKKTIVK